VSGTLVLFAKVPRPGRVKTRLVPPLTHTQAAALADAFLRDTLALGRHAPVARRLLAWASALRPRRRIAGYTVTRQQGRTLGDRLLNAFRRHLRPGRAVLILGTDSPTLPAAYLRRAVQALATHDLVVGPTQDGGYYLIGARRIERGLFRGIRWSSSEVCRQTLVNARRLGYTVAQLPRWYDVDTPRDLRRLARELRHKKTRAPHTWRVLQQLRRQGRL